MDTNILHAFAQSAAKLGDATCYRYKRGARWEKLTWREADSLVSGLALQLERKGVKRGNRVAIFSPTRIEWSIADLAIIAAGAVTVPIYPTLPRDRVEHILKDADIHAVFVGNDGLNESIAKIAADIGRNLEIMALEGLIGGGNVEHSTSIKERAALIAPDDVATIIYTSGTTGVPKGVVLTHRNLMAEVNATSRIISFSKDEIGLMCLPLAHVLGRLMQFHHLKQGYQVAFIESFDKFAQNCVDVRPHFIVGVPRIIEKMHERLTRHFEGASLLVKKFSGWGIEVGKRVGLLHQKHRPVPFLLKVKYFLASKLIYKKIAGRLGGRLKIFISGGAPLLADYAKFFQALGLLVLEGYGLTETFAAATVNRPDDYHFGTVGKPVPGVDVKLAPDGEVLVKGPTVFREYLNMPDETRAAKTPDGWFKTGDIGEISRDGFLRITDRKKDIIVTSGGENVAPQLIESLLTENRFINYCMVYGDRKKYLVALITLDPEAIREYAAKTGINSDFASIANHPKVRELVTSIVKEKNAVLARHETIKKFAILGHDFSVETGELTPTLKVRRRFTAEKYKDILEGLYRE